MRHVKPGFVAETSCRVRISLRRNLILDCDYYDEFRTSLFEELNIICDFDELSRTDKYNLIMSANDGDIDFCFPIATFILSFFEKRSNTRVSTNLPRK